MCPVAEAKLFFCNSFPQQQLIFRVSCGAAGSLTARPNADGQIQHIFCRTSWQFWNTLKPRMTQLVDQFLGSVVLHLGLRLYVLTELTQMQREGVFFKLFIFMVFLSARWQRGGQCFFKILSYLWIFYQPGAKGGRCLGNKCPSFRYLGQRLLLLILLLLGLHNAVHHQLVWFPDCIAEGAYIAVCSAILNRTLMQCNTLKYCTALLGVEVVV